MSSQISPVRRALPGISALFVILFCIILSVSAARTLDLPAGNGSGHQFLPLPAGETAGSRSLQAAGTDHVSLTAREKKLSPALRRKVSTANGDSPFITSLGQPPLQAAGVPVLTNGVVGTNASADLVYVYITLRPDAPSRIMDPLVYRVTDRDEAGHIAAAWVNISDLAALASLDAVRDIREVVKPVVHAGSVTTRGDIILGTADVRALSGHTGAGMKIGVISDGVSSLASAQASGDLPAGVSVLSNTVGGDEGTAMLEIIHDMVPDADLYFHDMGTNQLAFNSAIDDLVANGCTVICDDVNYLDEPFFEDGLIASHMKTLSAGNVLFVSAAGNSGSSDPLDSRHHYQGVYDPAGSTSWHDFSRGTNATYTSLYLLVTTGDAVRIVLQWDDPWGQSANDYDLYLHNESGSVMAVSSGDQSGSGDPFEMIAGTWTGPTQLLVINVLRYNATAEPRDLELYFDSTGYFYPINIVPSDSIFGHQSVPGVIAVAAVPATGPAGIEEYSSRGPVTIAYPSREIRPKPDITGVDGVAISGAGGFPNPFYGTSAAAPHIAAVVAQYWGAHPAVTAAQVRSTLFASATDRGAAGWDTVFGYGLANATAMEAGGSAAGNQTGIGVFRPSTHTFYLRPTDYPASPPVAISWGSSTDIPVTGDWNGDNRADVGIFRPSTHTFYLRSPDYPATPPSVINWGSSTDIPVTGDWNGDYKTDVGIFRASAHTFYLRPTDYPASPPVTISWGISTDIPVTGDWNGDNRTDVGVFRPSTHTFYLRPPDYPASPPVTISWGAPADVPVSGDWS